MKKWFKKTVEAKVIIPTWYVKTNETMAIKVPHVKIWKENTFINIHSCLFL